MATETTNIKLKKPTSNEFFSIQDFNENADKIDQAFGSKANATKTFTATLVSTAWMGSAAPFSQEVTIDGIKQIDVPFVDVVLSNDNTTSIAEESAYTNISKVTTADGSITVRCNKKKPSVNLNLILKVVG